MYRPCANLNEFDALNAVFTALQREVEPNAFPWVERPTVDYKGRYYIQVHPAAQELPTDVESIPTAPKAIRWFVPIVGTTAGTPYPVEGNEAPEGRFYQGENLLDIRNMMAFSGINVEAIDAVRTIQNYDNSPVKKPIGIVFGGSVRRVSPDRKAFFYEPYWDESQRADLVRIYRQFEAAGHETDFGSLRTAAQLLQSQKQYDTAALLDYLTYLDTVPDDTTDSPKQ